MRELFEFDGLMYHLRQRVHQCSLLLFLRWERHLLFSDAEGHFMRGEVVHGGDMDSETTFESPKQLRSVKGEW